MGYERRSLDLASIFFHCCPVQFCVFGDVCELHLCAFSSDTDPSLRPGAGSRCGTLLGAEGPGPAL